MAEVLWLMGSSHQDDASEPSADRRRRTAAGFAGNQKQDRRALGPAIVRAIGAVLPLAVGGAPPGVDDRVFQPGAVEIGRRLEVTAGTLEVALGKGEHADIGVR